MKDIDTLIADPSTDSEMRALAEAERPALQERRIALEQEIRLSLLPKDAMDERSVVLEIRAGTGGDEASLFAGDLFRMYERYAAKRGWKVEVISTSEGTVGGFKEIIAAIEGRGAFARLKFESGVHRVQRVPDTETSGPNSHLRRDRCRASRGRGCRHRHQGHRSAGSRPCARRAPAASTSTRPNSAIRITHLPTGIVVSMQDDRSQHRNRAKAMGVLRARLYDAEKQRRDAERSAERRGQVGSGDRSERIRTYNFPQGRVTDHRINLTLYKLPQVLSGESLDELIDALITEHQASQLAAEGVA